MPDDHIPAGHRGQAANPSDELKVPAGHGLHADDVFEPVVLQNEPAGHREHVDCPKDALYDPAGQSVQARVVADELLGLKVPGGQSEQLAADVAPTLML